jgi:hypothetical protein
MVESFITFHSLQNYWIWLVPSPQRGTTFFEAHAKSATMLVSHFGSISWAKMGKVADFFAHEKWCHERWCHHELF